MKTTRRTFVKNTLAGAAGVGLTNAITNTLAAAESEISANNRINVALIGCRGRGFHVLKLHMALPEVKVVAMADVDRNILEERGDEVTKMQNHSPALYDDYRKLLESRDVDAVIIGTPDHWHCLQMVDAVSAGKDIYVEKPMANSIGEAVLMTKAARKYKRVVQVGQQQRSGKIWSDIMKVIQKDTFGKLRKIKIWGNFNYGIGPKIVPDSPVPDGVNYDFWLGPAPDHVFNPSRFHGSWRMFWDYGGGLMTDWGVHLLDMAIWAHDLDVPKSVAAYGGNFSFPGHARETPDTLSVIYELGDICLTWDHTAGTENGPYDRRYGITFTGDNGTIVANREGWELKPEIRNGSPVLEAIQFQNGRNPHQEHVRNFIECVKTRKEPNCPVETGLMAAIYAHLGNIAFRTNEKVYYDKDLNKLNTPAAELLKTTAYRNPWKLPEV